MEKIKLQTVLVNFEKGIQMFLVDGWIFFLLMWEIDLNRVSLR